MAAVSLSHRVLGITIKKFCAFFGLKMYFRTSLGVGCGEGVSPSPPGEGSGEGALSPENFSIFELK